MEVDYSNPSFTKFVWNDEHKNSFRTGLIGELPALNRLVSNIDTSRQENIDILLNNFTTIIRKISDPLFSKRYSSKQKCVFDSKPLFKSAEWFDTECDRASAAYQRKLCMYVCVCNAVLSVIDCYSMCRGCIFRLNEMLGVNSKPFVSAVFNID